MDNLERPHAVADGAPAAAPKHKHDDEPHLSLTAMRQQLSALRREAQLHEREALAECLTLAIALSSPRRSN